MGQTQTGGATALPTAPATDAAAAPGAALTGNHQPSRKTISRATDWFRMRLGFIILLLLECSHIKPSASAPSTVRRLQYCVGRRSGQ